MSEPEPLTPEERFALDSCAWYEAPDGSLEEQGATMGMIDALREMIASLDAEVARLTETINRQEKRLDEVMASCG